MKKTEKAIIELIEKNKFLSDELKKRYILALFLMNAKEQKEYLGLMEAFAKRCDMIENGIIVLPANEVRKVLRTVQEVKEDLIDKIQSSHEHN